MASVAAEIQAHLRRNPNAGDTVAGIRQWWLAPNHGWVSSDIVQAALEALVDRGAIGVRVLVSGERFYFGLDPTTANDKSKGQA